MIFFFLFASWLGFVVLEICFCFWAWLRVWFGERFLRWQEERWSEWHYEQIYCCVLVQCRMYVSMRKRRILWCGLRRRGMGRRCCVEDSWELLSVDTVWIWCLIRPRKEIGRKEERLQIWYGFMKARLDITCRISREDVVGSTEIPKPCMIHFTLGYRLRVDDGWKE